MPIIKLLMITLSLQLASVAVSGQQSAMVVKNSFAAQGIYMRGNYLPDGLARFSWRPELFGEYYPRPELRFSAELSLDNRLELLFQEPGAAQELHFEPYRAWAAAAWKNTELKAGLQHIRMGVAQIYRPLQWFDDLVPGAFLQDSKGVLALNFRHWFPNQELRVWALPGMGERLGTQDFSTREGTWEYGGRVGVSSKTGETGLSFDFRQPDYPAADPQPVREYRFGLDQRVDGFMGGWLEAELSVMDDDIWFSVPGEDLLEPRYSGAATLGGDYTFDLGNGLYTLAELNLLWSQENEPVKGSKIWNQNWRVALMLSYPLGLLDGFHLLGTYNDTISGRYAASLSWRRTYDKLGWDLTLGYDSANPLTLSDAVALSFTLNYDI